MLKIGKKQMKVWQSWLAVVWVVGCGGASALNVTKTQSVAVSCVRCFGG